MGNGLPSLPFFTSDFLIAVATWPTERVGAYCLALFYQWEHGFVPTHDASALALVLHTTPTKARRIWQEIAEKFHENGKGQARNLRLEEHRKEVEEKIVKSTEHGRKGARAKWHKHRLSTARAEAKLLPEQMPEQGPSTGNQSQNQNQDPLIKNDPVVEVLRVPPAATRTPEPMPGRASYLSESKIAYRNHRGYSMTRGPYYDVFLDRFNGDRAAAHAWLDAEIDAAYARGERPGQLFKFIDERWEKRSPNTLTTTKTAGNVAALQAFVRKGAVND